MRSNDMLFLCTGLAITFFAVRLTSARSQEARVAQDSRTQSTAGQRVLDFHVIHRTTREPLADVTLEIQINGQDRQEQELWEDETDSRGCCKIPLPAFRIRTLRIYPQKEGFVPLRVFWRGDPTPPDIPETFTVAMEPGVTIGGRVQNEQRQPVQDVTVSIHYIKDDPKASENARVNIMLHKLKTDQSGRWKFDNMPAEIDKNELRIFLQHPDYLSDGLSPGLIPLPITPQPPIAKLRDLSTVMVIRAGLEVTGRVTDKRGNPIAGAKIYDTEDYWWRSTKPVAQTDSNGQFRSNTNPGAATWTVQASGYAPDLRVVTINAGMPPVEIRLEPGRVIEGKVTDQAGKPIEEAWISAEDWRKNRRRLHLVAKTDADGNFRVTDAPADEVTFDIGKEGYMALENHPMKPGKGRYEITLRPTLKVRGTVVDAQTGQPIDKFTVTNGFDHEDGRAPQWDKHSVRTFTDGQYELEYMQEIFTYRIRVDAEGYQSAVSPCIRPDEIPQSNLVCDFKLEKAAPVVGTVLLPDGTPLSGAEVVIATHALQIANGKIDSRSSEHNRVLQTGSDGRFSFEPSADPYTVVVLHEQGYAKLTQGEFAASQAITVSRWGRIEGMLRIGSQPGADRLVAFLHESRSQMEQPRTNFDYETRTDKNGHFAFARVLPGEGVVTRAIPIDDRARRFSHSVAVEVKSGRTADVLIGGTGRPVIGKVAIPDIIKDIFDWQYIDHSLRTSSPNNPYRILALEFDKDGSFRVEDVPAGDYCVYFSAYEPPADSRSWRGEMIGSLSRPVSVPEMPEGRSDEPLDLRVLELQVVGKAALTPSLVGKSLPDLGGVKIDLAPAQSKGMKILVCFFDRSQRPSRHCINLLAKRAAQLKQEGVTIIAIQASTDDRNVLNEWIKENDIPFPVGMVQDDAEKACFSWGVRSLPWLILTDSRHIIRSAGFQVNQLNEKIGEIENVER